MKISDDTFGTASLVWLPSAEVLTFEVKERGSARGAEHTTWGDTAEQKRLRPRSDQAFCQEVFPEGPEGCGTTIFGPNGERRA